MVVSPTPTFGQTRSPFKTAAYQYVRASDGLPSVADTPDPDPVCKVKLFTGGRSTWFIAGVDADGTAYGVVVGAWGDVELGYFNLNEIVALRGQFGLPVERDLYFKPATTSAIIAAVSS